jgi:hypothetical protein
VKTGSRIEDGGELGEQRIDAPESNLSAKVVGLKCGALTDPVGHTAYWACDFPNGRPTAPAGWCCFGRGELISVRAGQMIMNRLFTKEN